MRVISQQSFSIENLECQDELTDEVVLEIKADREEWYEETCKHKQS